MKHTKKKKKNKHKAEHDVNGRRTEQEEINVDEAFLTGDSVEKSSYSPLEEFYLSRLPDDLLECVRGFAKPSPIQSYAWPFLLGGRDFIGISKPRSGKTLAFVVPVLNHVLHDSTKGTNPLCLVLSPHRELAKQIFDVLCHAAEFYTLKLVCLCGGAEIQPQISSLKGGADIVVATPGRLKVLIEMEACHLSEASFVVLDEADIMLGKEFREQVRFILDKISPAHQMAIFSTTWHAEFRKLAQEHMSHDAVKVVIGSEDLAVNHDVIQIIEVLDDHSRDQRLLALLEKYHESPRVLVFAASRFEVDHIAFIVRQDSGRKVVAVHGKTAQHDRKHALSLINEETCPLMVATDLAARGLDIWGVDVAIGYSLPRTIKDYVHRLVRTSWRDRKGVSHTFFTHHDMGLATELVNVLKEAGQVVPTDLLEFCTGKKPISYEAHVKRKKPMTYEDHVKRKKPIWLMGLMCFMGLIS